MYLTAVHSLVLLLSSCLLSEMGRDADSRPKNFAATMTSAVIVDNEGNG